VREVCKSFATIDCVFFSGIRQLVVHDSFVCSESSSNYAVTCKLGVVSFHGGCLSGVWFEQDFGWAEGLGELSNAQLLFNNVKLIICLRKYL
jgi:hypothetical protein